MAGGPVGALQIRLGANTAQFEQGMRRAQTIARQTGQNIDRAMTGMSVRTTQAFAGIRVAAAGLGVALGANFLIQQIRNTIQFASGLSETAQQIGVTVEQLQILRLAAEQNGASVEGMERAVAILNRTLGQAQAGLPAAVQSFRALGISQEQLRSFQNAGQAIPVVMEAISRFRTEAQQAAAAQRVFGRGAAELLPLLSQGAAGWDRATQAAIRNGLVTEEQARKADQAADAIGELASALRVQLLGAIVDALPGLIQIVRVLGQIISFAIRAIGLIGNVLGALIRPHQLSSTADVVGAYARNQSGAGIFANIAGQATNMLGRNPIRMGGGTDLDLTSPGGGGGRTRRDNNEAERRAQQVEQEARRLQIEELQARVQMVDDLDERQELNHQIADLERQQWLSEKSFAVSQGELSQAQFDRLAALQQIKLTTEENARFLEHTRAGQEREAEIAAEQAQAQEETLRAHIGLARTAEERRRLELELLEITYRNRRTALQMTIQNRPGSREAEVAQSTLADLPGRQRAETRTALRSTMGPLEAYMFELPRTAEQVREALQSVAVEGLQSISDGLIDVITGARKMGDVFRSVVTSIISDLIRIQLQKAVLGPLSSLLSGVMGGAGGGLGSLGSSSGIQGLLTGLPGRASGGPVLPGRMYVVGEEGPELLRMGGQGGHVIANDNIGGGGDVIVHQSFKFDGVAVTKDEFIRGLLATKDATMVAVREAQRRRA